MKLRTKIKIAIILAPILICVIWYGNERQTSIGVKNFSFFDSSNIDDIISNVEIINQGAGFKLKNSNVTFVFYPYTDELLNTGSIFHLFAKPGDRVIKLPYSDTLYLYKANRVYRYTFQHLGESE